jgi:hypothetical protein
MEIVIQESCGILDAYFYDTDDRVKVKQVDLPYHFLTL